MMHRRQFLSASALAAASSALPATLSARQPVNRDVAIIGDVLRRLHPGLHRYLSPGAFESGLARLDRQWQAASDLETRFLSLTGFLASIRCGHSYASLYNQKRAVAQQLFARKDRLPFWFRWIGGQMVVTGSLTKDAAIPRGSVITAISGVPTARILARLMPYVRADGGNDGKRMALLSADGADEIETFDVLYGLLFGAPKDGMFDLNYRAPGTSALARMRVPAIDLAARTVARAAPDTRSNEPIWQFAVDGDGVATLTMPGWAMYNSKWDWQSWLSDRLDSLSGAKGLIVDLRANEGGNDCGDTILARLAGRDIALPRERRLVRYRQIPSELNPYLDTWDDSFRNWGADAKPYDRRYFELAGDPGADIIHRHARPLSLPMAVLTSPQNSSATFRFASVVKATGLGKLVGGTTGGNRRGINGGAFFFVRLPESGLEFDLPLIGYFPETRQPDAGIKPDLAITNSAADIAAGFDRELAAAKAWITSR